MDSIKEKFSYAIGQQIGRGIMKDNLDVVPAKLVEGVNDALSGNAAKLSDQEMQEAIQEFQKQASSRMQEVSEKNSAAGKAFLEENKNSAEITVLDNGIQYRILIEGEGDSPSKTDSVTVHYRGTLIDGREFDSSYSRGTPTTFPVNGVIAGWQEVLQMMPLGAKWEVFIPPELAYGEQGAGGAIGPNEVLIFEMELISIN